MQVSLEQIFSSSSDEITNRSQIWSYMDRYVKLAEQYASSGQLDENGMYYMRKNHDLFISNLRDPESYPSCDMLKNLKHAMMRVKAHNAELILDHINRLIVDGNVNEAIKIRKSYNITDTELYYGVDDDLQPRFFLEEYNNAKIFIDYARVYNLNERGFLFEGKFTDYDVLSLFYLFFINIPVDTFLIVDRYFEIYNIPNNKYWYVYSLVVLYSVRIGYTNDFIQNYMTEHGSNVEEADKADLVIFIFMVVLFNIRNGEMLKFLVKEYNRIYPNHQNELNLALNYCIRRVFVDVMRLTNSVWINPENFNNTYPDTEIPQYLNYGIYNELFPIIQDYINTQVELNLQNEEELNPIISRFSRNNDYIDEVRRIIDSTSPGNAKRI